MTLTASGNVFFPKTSKEEIEQERARQLHKYLKKIIKLSLREEDQKGFIDNFDIILKSNITFQEKINFAENLLNIANQLATLEAKLAQTEHSRPRRHSFGGNSS